MGFFFGPRGDRGDVETDLRLQGRDILKTLHSIVSGFKINEFVDISLIRGLVETVNKTDPPEMVGGLLLDGIPYVVYEGTLWTPIQFEDYGNNLVRGNIQ